MTQAAQPGAHEPAGGEESELPRDPVPGMGYPDDSGSDDPPRRLWRSPRPMNLLVVVGLSTLVIIVCGLGAVLSGLVDLPEASAPEESGAAPSQQEPATSMSDGQWIVGTDIVPGSYTVTVADDSPGCAWERDSSSDGTAASVIATGQGVAGEKITIEILETDAIFMSKDCGTWEHAD